MLDIQEIDVILTKNINHIKNYGVLRLGIFGSYSKGHPSEDSDIDILITFELDKKTFDNYIDLKFYLEELLNKKIDLVIEENLKEELKEEILRSVHYVEAA